jgi:hypothetical protein
MFNTHVFQWWHHVTALSRCLLVPHIFWKSMRWIGGRNGTLRPMVWGKTSRKLSFPQRTKMCVCWKEGCGYPENSQGFVLFVTHPFIYRNYLAKAVQRTFFSVSFYCLLIVLMLRSHSSVLTAVSHWCLVHRRQHPEAGVGSVIRVFIGTVLLHRHFFLLAFHVNTSEKCTFTVETIFCVNIGRRDLFCLCAVSFCSVLHVLTKTRQTAMLTLLPCASFLLKTHRCCHLLNRSQGFQGRLEYYCICPIMAPVVSS